jgi:hypothetical protein
LCKFLKLKYKLKLDGVCYSYVVAQLHFGVDVLYYSRLYRRLVVKVFVAFTFCYSRNKIVLPLYFTLCASAAKIQRSVAVGCKKLVRSFQVFADSY